MRCGSAPLIFGGFLGLAFVASAGSACAADRCADLSQSMPMRHDGDRYQATTLLFAAARSGCEPEARALLHRGAAIDAKNREARPPLP